MPYRDWHISHCRTCRREREPEERFSARGRCIDCGEGMQIANRRQLRDHSGPLFDHWRRRCAAAFGVLPPTITPADLEGETDRADTD